MGEKEALNAVLKNVLRGDADRVAPGSVAGFFAVARQIGVGHAGENF